MQKQSQTNYKVGNTYMFGSLSFFCENKAKAFLYYRKKSCLFYVPRQVHEVLPLWLNLLPLLSFFHEWVQRVWETVVSVRGGGERVRVPPRVAATAELSLRMMLGGLLERKSQNTVFCSFWDGDMRCNVNIFLTSR